MILESFKIDKTKQLIDNIETWSGETIKVGRNVLKGFPVDIDESDGTYLDMTAVDRDAAAGLAKELRSVGFKVKLVNKDLSVEQ